MTTASSKESRHPVLRILSNLPRSGGTLLSRCLGCMQQVVLLSEISPVGARVSPQFSAMWQAIEWHGLAERPDFGPQPEFSDVVALIHRRCEASGRHLVIRDWAYIDYFAVPYFASPPGYPLLTAVLGAGYDYREVQLVRHPIRQWQSICQGEILKNCLDVDRFLAGYRRYLDAGHGQTRIRYEDFLRAPETVMERICEGLDLPYDPEFMQRWPDYDLITGDRFVGSSGFARRTIAPGPARPVPAAMHEALMANPLYREILDELDYDDVSPSG